MQRPKLDGIDRKILSELQENGRITNVDLSKRVDISAPPCLRRVRALEKAGIIRGYHADVEPKMLGFQVTVYVMVALDSQNDSDLRAFENQVREWDIVRECHMLNGDMDFILKCVAPDLSAFQAFLTEKLTAAPHVSNVKTHLTIRQSKNAPGVPIRQAPVKGLAEA